MLNVEMLSTGDEVLHGQIIDTNAAWLADFFFNQGLPLKRRHTVGDDLDSLVAILRERSEHADVLIVNGGLGPTSDDLSALAAATAKGEGLILHEAWLETMTRFFAERGRPMAASNRKQAEIPQSAEMINNPVGTACGFAVQLNRCLMFFTPGVPSEFKIMVEQEILPRLRERFPLPAAPLCLRLTTFGRSESELAQSLEHLQLPPGVVMGYRSSMPIIELKLTGPAEQREAMLALWPEVQKVAGESIVFEGTEGLPAQIARRLQERQLSLTLSEQFTGGLLALQLSRVNARCWPAKSFGAGGDPGAVCALGGGTARKTLCRSGAGGEWSGERSPELCAFHAGRHPRAAGEVRDQPPQRAGASGGLRDDGSQHAAPLAEWPARGR